MMKHNKITILALVASALCLSACQVLVAEPVSAAHNEDRQAEALSGDQVSSELSSGELGLELSEGVFTIDASPAEVLPADGLLNGQSEDGTGLSPTFANPPDLPEGVDLNLEEAMARVAREAEAKQTAAEPIAVPEPSAFALLACLGVLLLAMTLLRWHFDRSNAANPVAAD